MADHEGTYAFRVRYRDTDQMGTYFYANVLSWMEAARTEWTRELGLPYAEMERRGAFLPVVEAHVKYLGRAQYDVLLRAHTTARMVGRARIRFDVRIDNADTGGPVTEGYTVHCLVNRAGKPIRPPAWFLEFMERA